MATATLLVKISGTINGKQFNESFSQEVADINKSVSRIGTFQADAKTIVTHAVPGITYAPEVDVDADIMLVCNIGSAGGLQVTFNTSGDSVYIFLSAGSFMIMQRADAGGVINNSTTATTSTVASLVSIELERPSLHDPAAKFWMMGCYKYLS